MKFLYDKIWVPIFGYILSRFVFLIEGDRYKQNKIDDSLKKN